jgi:hypothetical protein
MPVANNDEVLAKFLKRKLAKGKQLTSSQQQALALIQQREQEQLQPSRSQSQPSSQQQPKTRSEPKPRSSTSGGAHVPPAMMRHRTAGPHPHTTHTNEERASTSDVRFFRSIHPAIRRQEMNIAGRLRTPHPPCNHCRAIIPASERHSRRPHRRRHHRPSGGTLG